uniref:Uncharacterized protein n=1 Tax=Nelumbo nucifera TaxID=4432 RepID=A0A822XQM5_NELNU|nr:TPA_asm: hypothetical protein HUJ06_023436 [Nelumbo nucifera]DAD21974.1 TPA_asm: hypothetical protein HUJ06_023437 [Nelumbo nucifera]
MSPLSTQAMYDDYDLGKLMPERQKEKYKGVLRLNMLWYYGV